MIEILLMNNHPFFNSDSVFKKYNDLNYFPVSSSANLFAP